MVLDLSTLTDGGTEQEPHFRLLVCRTCKTIDELPSADQDPSNVLLDITVERHGEDHIGVLYNVPAVVWMSEKMRPQVIEQIQGGGSSGLDVFGTQFYATKMQFADDAMACYKQHNRPQGQCPDYKSEKKVLKPGTAKARADAGLSSMTTGPKVYLCDFCPVKSFNMTKHNESKGLYK
jgi:hypothetical protein